jgi:hypothetical protein
MVELVGAQGHRSWFVADNGGSTAMHGSAAVTLASVWLGRGGYSSVDLCDNEVLVMLGRVRGATVARARRC